MASGWGAYDHYLYAAAALVGTLAGAWLLLAVMLRSRWAPAITRVRGVVPPFINILGVLFGLTLAFLANDTWNAHDRALAAIDRESDSLRAIVVLARQLPTQEATQVRGAVRDYAVAARAEWPLLAQQHTSPVAGDRADALLAALSDKAIVAATPPAIHGKEIDLALTVREARETRLGLSQTHVNPLKWAGMAFLGFMTMVSVALVHVGERRAMIAAVALFALASAPTAVIVLIHGNPFQPPAAVTATALDRLIEDLGPLS